MNDTFHQLEPFTLFSDSLIWQINRDYYQEIGIEAWSKGKVPHQITSNSLVGKTYAELILAFRKDLAQKGQTSETVYIIELGAGHGRLAFHILKHIEKLMSFEQEPLPPFCYILSDIAQKNLDFFKAHPQFKSYFDNGKLDFAFYDACNGKDIHLQHADVFISTQQLNQPIIAIGNYFFDSIPNDLFQIKGDKLSVCSIALESKLNPSDVSSEDLPESLQLSYEHKQIDGSFYKLKILDDLLEHYRQSLKDSYLFFPERGILCLQHLKSLSKKGMLLLSMDKGVHQLSKMDQKSQPEIITHGSFSLWVNYHALHSFCEKTGGKALLPSYSTFHVQVGCFLFLDNAKTYPSTHLAYQRFVDDFGPDDYNSIKKFSYETFPTLTFNSLIAFLRLSSYDATFFLKALPQFRKLIKTVSYVERDRISESLHKVWNFYFNIDERQDLALIIAGIFFDLAYYEDALVYYQFSTDQYGQEADTLHNKILCYYQLRQDDLFKNELKEAKRIFPDSEIITKLQALDLNAI